MLGSLPMKPVVYRLSIMRIVMLLWASLWMLAIPLFHVHPAVDHRYGGGLHRHEVAVHTVLSEDLDFEDHHNCDRTEGESPFGAALVDHSSHSLSDHPEIGVSLLTDSGERKSSKVLFTHAIVIDATLVSNSDLHTWEDPVPVPIRGSTILDHELRTRAPPILHV